MRNMFLSEWRTTTRQRSHYTLLLVWVFVLFLVFLLQGNYGTIAGYTNITGTMMNLILYILPIFMLIIGSFSVANEMENGQWRLLCTYPLTDFAYLTGKLGGQVVSQATLFTLAYGISIGLGILTGISFSFKWLMLLYGFSILILYYFLILGLLIGTWMKSRWQALMMSVAIWFFLIMIWPTALLGILGLLPYTMIDPIMKISLFFNPAEFIRIFFVVQLEGGPIFGQSFDSLVSFFDSSIGWLILVIHACAYLTLTLLLSKWKLGRRRRG